MQSSNLNEFKKNPQITTEESKNDARDFQKSDIKTENLLT